MDYSDAQVAEVMSKLGVDHSDLVRAQSCQRSLEALQRRVKGTYKLVALECHPDRTGGDDEKTALFQLATHVVQEIESMKAHSHSRRVRWAVRIRSMSVT